MNERYCQSCRYYDHYIIEEPCAKCDADEHTMWEKRTFCQKHKKAIMAVTAGALTAGLLLMLFTIPAQAAEAQDTYIKAEYQEHIVEIAGEYNICPELIMAIVEHESSGNPEAKNGSCKGLMQVSSKWHKDRMQNLGVSDLHDPYSNILTGTDYLAELFEKHEDIAMVLMTYNGSSDAAKRAETGNYTRYATSIMARAEELERLHGK